MSRAKYTRASIEQTITLFTRAAEKEYGSHAFAAGALSTMLAAAMEDMPLHKQKEIINTLSKLAFKDIQL